MNSISNSMKTLDCVSPNLLPKVLPDIVAEVEHKGFALFSAWDSEPNTLKTIAQQFGKIMSHIRNESGIVTIAYQKSWVKSPDENASIPKEDYQSYGTQEVIPHTDATYMDGINIIDDRVVRITPPSIIIFQCVTPAEKGGELILIDAQKVFRDILLENPKLAKILLTPGCISFVRDDLMALDFPVFQKMPDGSFRVRSHSDSKVYTPEWSRDAIKTLYEEYFSNPKYRVNLGLQPNDIVVIDNYRVLHGRAVYQVYNNNDIRHHRRVWIANEPPTLVQNFQDKISEKRAFQPYNAYRITSSLLEEANITVKSGIRWDAEIEKLLESI